MRLSAAECRVLGCLIEKERATPQAYPLTQNAVRLACNQTTNRDPVVSFDDPTVEHALSSLRHRGLTRTVYSQSNRAPKYRHVIDEALHLGTDELAVLAVLLLRGPQTVGELKGRTERLHPFADLTGVQATLDRLAERDEPLVVCLERRPGQKDVRWGHLLGETVEPAAPPPSSAAGMGPSTAATSVPAATGAPPRAATDAVIEDLTHQLTELRVELAALRVEFDRFRDQFS
jgi:uncharacterized protein